MPLHFKGLKLIEDESQQSAAVDNDKYMLCPTKAQTLRAAINLNNKTQI